MDDATMGQKEVQLFLEQLVRLDHVPLDLSAIGQMLKSVDL